MRVRARQSLEVLSISALDLFASALGVFILMAILMFPYYLRQPSTEADLLGAEAELSAAGRSLEDAERIAEAAAQDQAGAADALADARQRLRLAEQAAAAAARELAEASATAPAVRADPGTPGPLDSGLSIRDLDLVFVMDATGSMRGELRDLQANLLGMIRVLYRLAPSLTVGFVAYKDQGDEYVTRALPPTLVEESSLPAVLDFVRGITAGGGGDDPEPVDQALQVAVDMPWRADAQGRIIVIGDAPPRIADWGRAMDLAGRFRRSSSDADLPRTVSTIFTGRDPGVAAFFERLSDTGGGDFSTYQGQMFESVLLAVLRPDGRGGSGP